jgi:hypothetical protein
MYCPACPCEARSDLSFSRRDSKDASAPKAATALLIAPVLVLLTQDARAQDEAAVRQAANNLSHEYTLCHVYYQIVQQCLRKRADSQELADQYEKIAEANLTQAFLYGSAAGLMTEAIIARMKLGFDEQTSAIGRDCQNIAILNLEHAHRCKSITENPDGAFAGYLEQTQ